jgi:two-component system, chemotaxis family, chemotaxis protein CheY
LELISEKKMKKVLVIEDDAPLCWLLERILRGKYEVIVMNNGLEAWSWLSDGNSCDLIVSDVKMPSLDGIELLENLSNSGLFKNIPVIMLSGLEDSKKECLELGAFTYLVKPFEPRMFLSEVERAIAHQNENALVSQ